MENRSKTRRPAALAGGPSVLEKLAPAANPAQGRLDYGPPVAVIDVGSNSVRLVVYEGVTRSPTPLFNEKTLHHSEMNRSNKRRLGLAVRVTLPTVKVDHTQLVPGHRVIQLGGEDRHNLNLVMQPPV